MRANCSDFAELVAEQLGHSSQVTTKSYLADVPEISKARMRETVMGICGSMSRELGWEPRPCLTTPMARWMAEPWDYSDDMRRAAQSSIASNLVRCWSDLDRTTQLSVFLAARDC